MFFAASVAWRCDYVAAAVTGFIRLEVIECLRATSGERPSVSMMWIEAVVDVAMKTGRAMEPRSCSDKYAVNEPIGSVISIGRAVIRRVIEISIRTYRRNTDIHAYRNL
jgi:hypothetical protein